MATVVSAEMLEKLSSPFTLFKFPWTVLLIIGNELCERFSYYGLRAILVLYLTTIFGYSDSQAVATFSYASSFAFFMPLLGGYISDVYLGKFKTIIIFSIIYCIGGFTLAGSALGSGNIGACIAGLLLIGIGTGGIKPCVSSFGADQLDHSKDNIVTSYFSWFYLAINLGSIASFIVTPVVKQSQGYAAAFVIPAILLLVALFVFLLGSRFYKKVPPEGSVLKTFVKVIRAALANKEEAQYCQHWLEAAKVSCPEQEVQDVMTVWRIMPVLAMLPIYWSLSNQQGSSWTIQAKNMNLKWGSLNLPPETLGIINPVLIICFIPLFDKVVYPYLQRRGVACLPLHRMSIGMLFASFAFLFAAFVQALMNSQENGEKISVAWQFLQIICITVAEVLVSVTGLEFSYSQAPINMKTLVAALFLMTSAVGDLLTGFISNIFSFLSPLGFFLMFAFLMFLNFTGFVFVSYYYQLNKMRTTGNSSVPGSNSAAYAQLTNESNENDAL